MPRPEGAGGTKAEPSESAPMAAMACTTERIVLAARPLKASTPSQQSAGRTQERSKGGHVFCSWLKALDYNRAGTRVAHMVSSHPRKLCCMVKEEQTSPKRTCLLCSTHRTATKPHALSSTEAKARRGLLPPRPSCSTFRKTRPRQNRSRGSGPAAFQSRMAGRLRNGEPRPLRPLQAHRGSRFASGSWRKRSSQR